MSPVVRRETKVKPKKFNEGLPGERTPEYPLIQKAVKRTIREYGEALKKLARDD